MPAGHLKSGIAGRAPRVALALVAGLVALSARAGPPYLSDDPEPTDFRRYEIYAFAGGTRAQAGADGAFGIDFNYGATPDLQLTAALPVAYDRPAGGPAATGLGNIELAGKFRVLHQADAGVDVAVFPRVFLRSASNDVGDQHASLLLPLWLQKDWGPWSLFGGGGCVLSRGAGSRDYCLGGAVLTRQMNRLQLGLELEHEGADAPGARAVTVIGAGARYDLTDRWHLLGYFAPGVQDAAETRYAWYASVLLTV